MIQHLTSILARSLEKLQTIPRSKRSTMNSHLIHSTTHTSSWNSHYRGKVERYNLDASSKVCATAKICPFERPMIIQLWILHSTMSSFFRRGTRLHLPQMHLLKTYLHKLTINEGNRHVLFQEIIEHHTNSKQILQQDAFITTHTETQQQRETTIG